MFCLTLFLCHLLDHFNHHRDPKIKKKSEMNANKTGLSTKAMFPDRLECLKDDNIRLKSTQKELESEIKVIATKFKRQINLLKKERMVGQTGQRSAITAKFETEFNDLIEENNRLQMQEQDLMEKVRKLNAKRKKELANGKTLYSTVNQGMEKTSKAELEGAKVLRNLQATLNQTKDRCLTLVRDIEGTKRMASSALNMEELYRERRQAELNLMQAKGRLEDIKASLKVKSDIFDQGKSYETQLFNEVKKAQNETNALTMQQVTLKSAAAENSDIKERLLEARQDRDRLQNEFDTIMRQPFFKKQSDDTGMKQLEQLQQKLEAREKEIANSKQNILKTEENLKTTNERIKHLSQLKGTYEDEIAKMKAHLDPTSLSLNDVMKKLQNEDPSRFREVMNDLEYEGRDPAWYTMGYEEQLSHLTGKAGALQEDSMESLNEHKERLIKERFNLVTELNQIQKQLKLLVDLDKQNAQKQQAELAIVQNKIRQQTMRSNELTQVIKTQNDKLLTIQEQRGPSGLTQADLQRFNQEMEQLKTETRQVQGLEPDAMSEVTTRTDDSELGPQDNLLDLRISSATFNRTQITQILTAGKHEVDPGTIQTFLAVDFYNHDTKNTDMTFGLEPIYNTLFSFRNTVDDFYIKYLERDTILIDIFYIPKAPPGEAKLATGALKLGSAKLPLNKLLEKDYSFQAQEIVYIGEGQIEVPIGKVFYRMRPRKPLDEAIKWYKQKQLVKNQRTVDFNQTGKKKPAQDEPEDKLQVVEIEVKTARGLRISGQQNAYAESLMRPFFTYDFYTFTHESAVVNGQDPTFGDRKQFQVAQTAEFINYMNTSILKIDFIDESVEMTAAGARDYIGSARIPLKNLLQQGSLEGDVEVRDEHSGITGKVRVRMTIQDARKQAEMSMYGDATNVMQHRRMHSDTIQKIALGFSNGPDGGGGAFEEIDMYFDMLFMKDNTNMQRVTRDMFIDFILIDMRVPDIKKQDLEILLRTHELLAGKTLFTRQELKAIFERPFKDARVSAARVEAENPNQFSNQYMNFSMGQQSRGENPFLTQNNERFTAFGASERPKMPADTPFGRATGGQDDLARATIPPKPDRETFGVVPDERTTMKLGGGAQEERKVGHMTGKSTTRGISMLETLLKQEVYKVINAFTAECGADFPGATLHQTQTVLRKLMLQKGEVREDEIVKFFENNCIGHFLYFNQCLMKKYGKSHKIPSAWARRSTAQSQKLLRIKRKLQDYIVRKEQTVAEFTAIIDRNGDKEITLQEFVPAVKTFLNEIEATELFTAIDHDNSHSLTSDEVNLELSSINAAIIIDKIKARAKEMKFSAAQLFDTYDNNRDNKMNEAEFFEFIDQAGQQTDKVTADYIFKTVDKQNKGYVSKEDLQRVLGGNGDEILTVSIFTEPQDIFLPLGTTIKSKLQLTISQAFESFKTGPDELNYESLYNMIDYFMGLDLLPEEKISITDFLDSFGKSKSEVFVAGQLNRSIFEQLFITDFANRQAQQVRGAEAKASMRKIRQAMRLKQISLISELEQTYQTANEKVHKDINMRTLKHFLFKAASLQSYELDNVVKYLDRDSDGYIKIVDIQSRMLSEE